jgi:hypothetical protein
MPRSRPDIRAQLTGPSRTPASDFNGSRSSRRAVSQENQRAPQTTPRIPTDGQPPRGPSDICARPTPAMAALGHARPFCALWHVYGHCLTSTCACLRHFGVGCRHRCGHPSGAPAVGKWPTCALPVMVAPAGHLPTAPTPLSGHSRPIPCGVRTGRCQSSADPHRLCLAWVVDDRGMVALVQASMPFA